MIFDIETDGLDATKIHVMSWYMKGEGVISTSNYEVMRDVLDKATSLVGHNIIRFDIPILERILDIDLSGKRKIDTLPISWYLYPKRLKHGLEEWAEEFGLKKPQVEDWENDTYEVYQNRCSEDVIINKFLYDKQCRDLAELYEGSYSRIINYLTFKMDCAREQERSKWRVDVDKCQTGIDELQELYDGKHRILLENFPKVPVMQKREKPKKPFKKDGSVSAAGDRWFTALYEQGLPKDHDEPIKVVVRYDDPKPTSGQQVKNFLFSLGWQPEHFKYVRNKTTGEVKKIPQIKHEDPDRSDELCPSVMRLAEKHPIINELAGFSQLTHRLNFLKAIKESVKDGYVKATIAGFTNTLRFKHKKPLANIPGVDKPYGELIRSCLIAREGYELCGSDQSSLEDRTKLHYMYDHDPEYVEEMSQPGFDPHLDLAMQDGALTPKQVQAYKDGDKTHKGVRYHYKTTNYSGLYGVGEFMLSKQLRCSMANAEKLLNAYWKRNWSVKEVASEQIIKTINGQMWLLNPVSQLWYSLRYEKDIFSTLNQGTGVYCFDTWVKFVRKKRPQLTAQFHDEIVLEIKKGSREKCEKLLRWAVDKLNEKVNLNRRLDIDVEFGNNYAEVH